MIREKECGGDHGICQNQIRLSLLHINFEVKIKVQWVLHLRGGLQFQDDRVKNPRITANRYTTKFLFIRTMA